MKPKPCRLLAPLFAAQALLGAGVMLRLLRAMGGRRIGPSTRPGVAGAVGVIVPVLDEERRLAPCLAGLAAQETEVVEILVVDGGSRDGTKAVTESYTAHDRRIRWVNASPVPAGWNGKAWGLQAGSERIHPRAAWLLTVDADVRPRPGLVRALVAQAEAEGVAALSVATAQEIDGPGEGLVHPAMLATLVYRFGIPGHVARRVARVQANGQCFLVRREALAAAGGFATARDSVCEDVTLARALVRAGVPVGFYETDGLVSVRMYEGWWETWCNWSRSLPMRDRFHNAGALVGLAEVTLAQALPLPLLVAMALVGRGPRWGWAVNMVLLVARLGVLVGVARAYRTLPWTYALSPLVDAPVVARLWINALRRRHTWRGRPLVRG